MLALWIAKHQMNTEFKELFGAEIPLIPLRDAGNIEQGNATELDWEKVCPKSEDGALYVIGNPPYAGAKRQSADQKQDFVRFFGTTKYSKNLDYIAMWFIKRGTLHRRRSGASWRSSQPTLSRRAITSA